MSDETYKVQQQGAQERARMRQRLQDNKDAAATMLHLIVRAASGKVACTGFPYIARVPLRPSSHCTASEYHMLFMTTLSYWALIIRACRKDIKSINVCKNAHTQIRTLAVKEVCARAMLDGACSPSTTLHTSN